MVLPAEELVGRVGGQADLAHLEVEAALLTSKAVDGSTDGPGLATALALKRARSGITVELEWA